jgi:DNA-binding NarL/FixJ family response regulator
MIRTLVVDDQNIIREGIKVLLENATEISIVGYAEDGESALEKIEALKPDVILLDINLPGIDGLTVADTISDKFPLVKVIMLSSYEDNSYVIKAMESSAKGYLLKSVSSKELEWAIKLVHQGYSAFKSELLETLTLETESNSKLATKSKALRNFSDRRDNIPVQSSVAMPSTLPVNDEIPDELELLLAKNQFREKYSDYQQQQPRSQIFHSVRINRIKKTIMSFEFKLLVFIILFSLGFLIFVALS